MHIVLLYPPPWKIAAEGRPAYPPGEGPPAGMDPAAVDSGDFLQAPYGLLSLASQAEAAGHAVSVFNLANFPWPDVEALIARLHGELFGLSCLTVNRRGTAMLAQLIRDVHPGAHIVVGGPHVTALPEQTLRHVAAIDTVVLGEGEETFLDLARRIEQGGRGEGIAGSAWRRNGEICLGPRRKRIRNLDALASPARRFPLHLLLTSRGCPNHCTFCGSHTMWGSRVTFHSVDYVLDALEAAVTRHNQRTIAIKDDTFTMNRRRVLAICEGIRKRRLDFIWSCDTRADCVDAELLQVMRRAGCTRISFGVESGSETIRRNIRKRISLEKLEAVTRDARQAGLEVRYYMMVGNRGETVETFEQSLALLRHAQPDQFVFSQLHLYPGTEEFEIFRRHGLVSPEIFFQRDFFCLTCFAGRREDEQVIRARLNSLAGIRRCRVDSVADCQARLALQPGLPLAHVDLCRAHLRADNPDAAEHHLRQALALGYCLPGLALNLEAAIAAARGDVDGANRRLQHAARLFPYDVVLENLQRLEGWMADGAGRSRPRLKLAPGDGFESLSAFQQPEFPAPVAL